MKLDIEPQQVVDLAAEKLLQIVLENDEYSAIQILQDKIDALIKETVTDEMRAGISEKIDAALQSEMEKALSQEIVPVDIWGEAKGEPTTIRQQLHKRALEYWEERVEKDRNNSGRYRVTTYGGTPRHKLVFQDVAKDAFEAAMKENIGEMVKAFRDAMRKDAAEKVGKHIDSIINSRALPK